MTQIPPPDTRNSLVILIPAYNEETSIGHVIRATRNVLSCEVIVIDDASNDDTISVARSAGASVLPLSMRLGAWGAMQTGLRYAWRQGYRIAVTLDADGQHEPACIGSLLEPLQQGRADVVIGACPARVSSARRFAWTFFRFLTGFRIEDITSGFRAYNREAIRILSSAEASLLDYQDVGVLLILLHKNLRIVEMPVVMAARMKGISRVFSSWFIVAKYMLQTSLLCIARIGMNGTRPRLPRLDKANR